MQLQFKKTISDKACELLFTVPSDKLKLIEALRLIKEDRHQHYKESNGRTTTIAGFHIIRDEEDKFPDEVQAQRYVGGSGTLAKKF